MGGGERARTGTRRRKYSSFQRLSRTGFGFVVYTCTAAGPAGCAAPVVEFRAGLPRRAAPGPVVPAEASGQAVCGQGRRGILSVWYVGCKRKQLVSVMNR